MSHAFSRRAACAGLASLGVGLLLPGRSAAAEPQRRFGLRRLATAARNSDFYGADGQFNAEAAKDACLALLRRFGYPFTEDLRKTMAVTDFGLGRFLEVGLGMNIWINDKRNNFASLDIFLLPGQTIPEHWHVAVPAENIAAKMEVWHVRYGSSFVYGEGTPVAKPAAKIYENEKPFLTVMHETVLQVGQVAGIARPLEKHWQQAGPAGAIITETATYHSGAAVRFTNPQIKF